ncbi:MAG: YveK family protein [Candidatus Saccharimonadaceae bacterium]
MEEINLYKLLRFYVRNWLLVASLTLLGLAAGLAYNQFIQVPMYKSSSTLLFINPAGRGSTQDSTWLNNYVQLFESRRVIEPVMNDEHINETFDQFIGSVSAVNDKGTEVIRLTVATSDPKKSEAFLRKAVISFKSEAKQLYGSDNLRVVDDASDAVPPYNVKKGLQLAIATGAGFVLSLIVLFFIYDASGGKAGALGIKKRAPKVKRVKVAKVARVEKPSVMKARAKVFFAQLGEDFKNGLWIESTHADEDSDDDDGEEKPTNANPPKND